MIAISLTFSTLLCFFTNSWLVVWVLLEINTLSFCSITTIKTEANSAEVKERLMKYLVVQSIASAILITARCIKESRETFSPLLPMIVTTALLIKIAAVPFHYWFVQVSKKLDWINNKILFTWQKMLPIYLITFQIKKFIFPFIVASAFWGSVFLINKKSFKEILALSSVFNLGWLLLAVTLRLKILLIFSVIYWTRLIFFIEEISKNKAIGFNEKNRKSNKTSLFLKTINLAGIPPLIMFIVKWMTFSRMLTVGMLLLASFVLIISRVNIFIYLRMARTTLLQNPSKEQKAKTWKLGFKEISFLTINFLTLQLFV